MLYQRDQANILIAVTVVALTLLIFVRPLQASTLEEIGALADGATQDLPLRLMDRYQPSIHDDPENWMRWERARIGILEKRRMWSALVDRLDARTGPLKPAFDAWANSRMASAFLQLGRNTEARDLLVKLVWQSSPEERKEGLVSWRRMLARSYVQQGLAADARLAMLRQELDYGEQDTDWRQLRVRALLLADRPEDAARALQRPESLDETVLGLLARARSSLITAEDLVAQVRATAEQASLSPTQRFQLWAVAAEAAVRFGLWELEVEAREMALSAKPAVASDDPLFRVDSEALWQAYKRLAEELANTQRLLVGRFADWNSYAQQVAESTPRRARAIYAYLAFFAPGNPDAREAAAGLVASLVQEESGLTLLKALGLHADWLQRLGDLPPLIRYKLAAMELAAGDAGAAVQLMSGLRTPPPGVSDRDWGLHRAQIAIGGGDFSGAVEVIEGLLASLLELTPPLDEALIGLILDMQTAGEHESAVKLLMQAELRTKDAALLSQIRYWMAESRWARQAYEEAARLYLKAAGSTEDAGWSRLARRRAAAALMRAGLSRDAKALQEKLLDEETVPAQRALLLRALRGVDEEKRRRNGRH